MAAAGRTSTSASPRLSYEDALVRIMGLADLEPIRQLQQREMLSRHKQSAA